MNDLDANAICLKGEEWGAMVQNMGALTGQGFGVWLEEACTSEMPAVLCDRAPQWDNHVLYWARYRDTY